MTASIYDFAFIKKRYEELSGKDAPVTSSQDDPGDENKSPSNGFTGPGYPKEGN
jgi:hypothetical protein